MLLEDLAPNARCQANRRSVPGVRKTSEKAEGLLGKRGTPGSGSVVGKRGGRSPK